MKASIHLGRVWNIPIGLHTSWFIIFALITFSLGTGYFPEQYPQLNAFSSVVLAVLTSLLFFGSVLAHELGHSFVALRNKIPVKGITLFVFGGVAQIEKEPDSPGAEFRIAIAGPLVSLALGAVFLALGNYWGDILLISAPSLYLARINLMLALFNLIPGFPLDGGRVFRALLWGITKSFEKATRWASASGQLVAFGFIGVGIFSMFSGDITNGLWLVFIGWFLQSAASSATRQLTVKNKLQGVTVADAMSRDCVEVHGLTTLNQLVQDYVLKGGQHCFFIKGYDGEISGMLTLQDITRVPQMQWRYITAEQRMAPLARMMQLEADTDLLEALKIMEAGNISEAPVMRQNNPIGLLSKDQVLRYLQLRAKLGM